MFFANKLNNISYVNETYLVKTQKKKLKDVLDKLAKNPKKK